MTDSSLRAWKTLSTRTILAHSKFLTVESHTIQLPDGSVIEDWPWIIIPSAAIVLASTADRRFLCFRQTKYAVEGTSLAPVGGMLEPGEAPLEAAKRELSEETGYESPQWIHLGDYKVDPNRGVAVMHFFYARQARKVRQPSSDDLEDQQLLKLSIAELEEALHSGGFRVLAWATVVAMALLHERRAN
jgi:ADP-ribose pyrophosphatase